MLFSEVYSAQTIAYSQDGSLIAIVSDKNSSPKIIVLENKNQIMRLVTSFTFSDTVSGLEISPDNGYIFYYANKRGLLEARSLRSDDWHCKIEEPSLGISGAKWVPDSRQIMVFSDFQLKLSIFNLCTKSVAHVKYPKFPDKGYSFSSDGKFLALAERKETKDYLAIYYCGDWKLVNYFAVDTFDLQDIQWSANNSVIAVYESCLEYRVLLYSPSNSLLIKHQAYQNGLGVKSYAFSNKSTYLAVGAYDEKLRFYNVLTSRFIGELDHVSLVREAPDLQIFREDELPENQYGLDLRSNTKLVLVDGSVKIQTMKYITDKPNPPIGVSQVAWSYDDMYIASKNDNMPNSLWIWDMQTFTLKAIFLQLTAIKSFAWSVDSNVLFFSTGAQKLYIWTPAGSSLTEIPREQKMNINKIDRFGKTNNLLLIDKSELQVAFTPEELFQSSLKRYPSERRSEFQLDVEQKIINFKNQSYKLAHTHQSFMQFFLFKKACYF